MKYSNRFISFVDLLMQKEPGFRPYVSSLIRNAPKYFGEDIIREYKNTVFSQLKKDTLDQVELDYIY